jgi:Carboxypeptidase regulatory-like domain
MKRAFVSVAVFCLSCTSLFCQTSQVAQVSGRVLDPTGASVPGAQVTITDTDTNATHTTQTNSDGAYVLPDLPVGHYRLQVRMAGFSEYVLNGVTLDVDTHPELNVTLEVGQVAQQVEVQASAAMVETQSNGVGQLIEDRSVVDLPLNGRNVQQLVALSGAATNMTNSGSGQSLISNKNYPSSVAYSVAGSQSNQTLYVLDGSPNMDPVSNVALPMPFPDALQEFKLQTSSLPANYGAQPGGVVNVITKAGTNSFHGDAFEFVRNGALDARNYFALAADSLKRNQFGGTIGGPILRDKLFFFAGYQGTYESSAPSANIAFVDTQAALNGDFSSLASAACNGGKTPLTLKAPFNSTDQVNPSLFNPVSLAVLKLMPVSTDPCGELTYTIPTSDHENQIIGKVDWAVTPRQSFFARYYVTDYLHPYYYTNDILTMSQNSSVGLADRVNTFVLGHTFTFSPNILNSFRASYARSAIHRTTPNSPTPENILGNGQGISAYQGVPNYMFFSVGSDFTVDCQNCSPGPWVSNDFQVNDDLTIIHGRHQIAVGGSWLHSHLNSRGNFQDNGDLSFSNSSTGLTLADFMLGDLSSIGQSMGQVAHDSVNIPGAYAQDNIRINSRLSINPGIRWDPFLLPVNWDGQNSIFNPTWFADGVHSTRFPNAPVGTLFYGDPGMPGRGYGFGKIANFAPRFGIVYDPRGKGLETIRAGYGIFYGATPLFLQAGTHAPFAGPITVSEPISCQCLSTPYADNPGGNPLPVPSPPPSTSTFPLFGGGLGNFEAHPKPTYMQQWNISVQKQIRDWLFSATYLGNRTVHLEIGDNRDPEIYVPGSVQGGQCTSVPGSSTGGVFVGGPYNGLSDGLTTSVTTTSPTLNCSQPSGANVNWRRLLTLTNPSQGKYYGGETLFGDFGFATYNGLLLSAQHRFAQNFSVLSNLTWSHCLDTGEAALNGAASPQNYLDPQAEYANCASDQRYVVNVSIVARTPHRFGSEWLSRIVGDWQVAPIITGSTGTYSTVTQGGTDTSLVGSSRPNLVPGQAQQPADKTLKDWVNLGAYSNTLPGTFGDLSRSTILNPGAWNVDIALSRLFPLTERQTVAFRAEAFDFFNHPDFGAPGTSLASPNTFGQITATVNPNTQRIMQLSVKYTF